MKIAKTATIFSKWQSFAKSIGVPDEEIKRIDDSGGSGQEKCFTSLETWKNTAGEDATIPGLSTHLKKSRQDRLSREFALICLRLFLHFTNFLIFLTINCNIYCNGMACSITQLINDLISYRKEDIYYFINSICNCLLVLFRYIVYSSDLVHTAYML